MEIKTVLAVIIFAAPIAYGELCLLPLVDKLTHSNSDWVAQIKNLLLGLPVFILLALGISYCIVRWYRAGKWFGP